MDLKKKKSVYKGEKTSISWLDITGAGGEKSERQMKNERRGPAGFNVLKAIRFLLVLKSSA